MEINATLLGQAIVFAILVWFTWKYIWPPLIQAMHDRQKKISEGLAAAERGKRDLQDAKQQVDALLTEAREQAQEILANANKQAAENIEQSKQTARQEAERIVENGHAQVQQEVQSARDALRREVGVLAVAGAERILRREIDEAAHQDILKELVAEV